MPEKKPVPEEHEGNEPLEMVPDVPAVTEEDDRATEDPNEVLYGSDTEED